MSEYMILIYGDESAWASMSPEEAQAGFEAFMEYNRDLTASGSLRSGGQLQPSFTATTLRGAGGSVAVHDGPYAESKEQLGGFYIVACASREEAIALAQRCPVLFGGGSVEVRALGTRPEA
jgi:hypothetical protein